jgi:hypothetical protein
MYINIYPGNPKNESLSVKYNITRCLLNDIVKMRAGFFLEGLVNMEINFGSQNDTS